MFSILHFGCLINVLILINAIQQVAENDTIYEGPKYVLEGSNFTIKCNTSGLKFPKWTRNGTKIETKEEENLGETAVTGIRRQIIYNGTNATKDHAGHYKCHDFSTTEHEIVVILGYITNEEEEGKPLVVDLRKDFVIVCNVTANPQEVSMPVTWTKDGEDITEVKGKYAVFSDNNTLLIHNASEEDCVTYSCRFNHSDVSKLRTISVQSRPIIQPKLAKSINKVEEETLTLSCSGYGVPTPEIAWYKDKVNLNSTDNPRITLTKENQTLTLTIKNLEEDDRADYNCTVTNEHGSQSSVILVRVKDKLAALWPFLGIVAEVAVLCTIIFIYEKRRAKQEFDESDTDQSPDTKNVTENKDKEVRQRK